MSKQTTKAFVHGNFEVEVSCVVADISEELSIAEPGKQEVSVGIKRIRHKSNVGDTGGPTWKEMPKSLDYAEIVTLLAEKDDEIRRLRAERTAISKRLKSYEVLGTAEEVQDAVSNSV